MSSPIELSKTQKALLAWSAAFLIMAEVARHLRFEEKILTSIGLFEVLLAIATGIAFGLSASVNKN